MASWSWIGGGHGNSETRARLENLVFEQFPDCLLSLLQSLNGIDSSKHLADLSCLSKTPRDQDSGQKIGEMLTRFGSDKSTKHNYHDVYGIIFNKLPPNPKILEIGLGSSNTEILSSMGASGSPGASIRALMAYFPASDITGVDIDKSIEVEGASILFVDQTNPSTFQNLRPTGDRPYDLIIEDGLHAVNTSMYSLIFGIENISSDGIIVIEDISMIESVLDIWRSVEIILSSAGWHVHLLKSKRAAVLCVSKKRFLTIS